MMTPTTTITSLWEKALPQQFSNCSREYQYPKDDQYLKCIKYLPNEADYCDYLWVSMNEKK